MVSWMKWDFLNILVKCKGEASNMNSGCTKESLKADLDRIWKGMPVEILDQEGLLRLASITTMLPAGLSSFWGLECRLNTDEPITDVSFEIKNNTIGQKLLAGQSPSWLDSLCSTYSIWSDIRDFASQWIQESSILNKHVRNLWLEFDAEDLKSHHFAESLIGNPSVFMGFRSKELSKSELAEILHHASDLLHLPDFFIACLQSFMNSIPSSGQLFQLGSMLGRPSRDIRVCVNQLPPDVIPGWLSEIGWSGNKQGLSELLERLSPLLKGLAIDLNLTEDGPSSKIGIECYMDRNDKNPKQWEVLLDFVNEFVLCNLGKRKGLLQYPGTVTLIDKTPDSKRFLAFKKMIHHFKLGFDGQRITDAKAYLAVYKAGLNLNNNWFIE